MKGLPFLLLLRRRLWRRRVIRVVVTVSRHQERPAGVHAPAGYLREYKHWRPFGPRRADP